VKNLIAVSQTAWAYSGRPEKLGTTAWVAAHWHWLTPYTKTPVPRWFTMP